MAELLSHEMAELSVAVREKSSQEIAIVVQKLQEQVWSIFSVVISQIFIEKPINFTTFADRDFRIVARMQTVAFEITECMNVVDEHIRQNLLRVYEQIGRLCHVFWEMSEPSED